MRPVRSSMKVLLVCAAVLLSGCTAMVKSTPIADGRADDTTRIRIVDALPAVVPKSAVPFPHGLYLFAAAESATGLAVSMLVPIPFVTDAALAQLNKSRAEHYKDAYIAIDPYRIAMEAASGHPLFAQTAGPISLYPFVVVQECSDGTYRSTLIFQATDGKWLGRYLYPLPTPIPKADFASPTGQELQQFSAELREGAAVLVTLVERDARGALGSSGTKVDLGSYFLVGSKPAGLLSPDMVLMRGADLIEEDADHVLVRSQGQPAAEVQSLGLAMGVHYFRRDQLHTYRKQP